MTVLLRAWVIAAVLILVGFLGVGALAAMNPDGWVLNVAPVVVLALTVGVVGAWYRRYRPDSRFGEFAVAVVPFPALVCVLGLWLRHRAGAEPKALLISVIVEVLVLVLVAAAARRLPVPTLPGGYR